MEGGLGATDRGWWMMDCDQVFRWSWSQVGRLTGNMKSWCFDPRRQTSRHFYYDMTGSWELRGCKYQINILFYINSCLDVTLCWNNTCHKIENNSIQKLAWNFSTIRYNQKDPHKMTQNIQLIFPTTICLQHPIHNTYIHANNCRLRLPVEYRRHQPTIACLGGRAYYSILSDVKGYKDKGCSSVRAWNKCFVTE